MCTYGEGEGCRHGLIWGACEVCSLREMLRRSDAARDVARLRREEAEKARDGYRSSWLDEESRRMAAEKDRDEWKTRALAAESWLARGARPEGEGREGPPHQGPERALALANG